MKALLLFIICLLFSFSLSGQISVDEYSNYLLEHKNMEYEELLEEYPAGRFLEEAPIYIDSLEFWLETKEYLSLSEYETDLIKKNGFMVTSRISNLSFLSSYFKLYNNDLPVYISSDAILHAMHYSFNKIYQYIEEQYFYNDIVKIIGLMKNDVDYFAGLSTDTLYQKAINDLDIYLTVAQNLILRINNTSYDSLIKKPVFDNNLDDVAFLLERIYNEGFDEIKLFSDSPRPIVFADFKPRGHYTETKKMEAYFRTMMWFGSIEIMINDSCQHNPKYEQKEIDIRRQTLLALLITLASKSSKAFDIIQRIERYQTLLVGKQDNITCFDFDELLMKYNLNNPVDFIDKDWSKFLRYHVSNISSSNQLYSSQILFSNIYNPEMVKPSTAFKLFGQRPVIDGFITYNVVYDRIFHDERKVFRALPNTLDLLFVLKNDAAIQLLEDEISNYHYSSNLAALRYLINSYDDDFWNSSLYNTWLNTIMKLNPPDNRDFLPKFMQTAAWWQKTMNTQLASWSQLRHDFILSVKKPFTAGLACFFPDGFVEPLPELYESIRSFSVKLRDLIVYYDNFYYGEYGKTDEIIETLWSFQTVMSKLTDISKKELDGNQLDSLELKFINNMIADGRGCVKTLGGWYTSLYYGYKDFQVNYNEFPFETTVDISVADVHTQPTDEYGDIVGRVLHCGTGYPNTAVVVFNNTVYTGFVMSYYEDITKDFFVYNDSEWREKIDNKSFKTPEFTNLYLADFKGGNSGIPVSLWTRKEYSDIEVQTASENDNIYPNPASHYTLISYSLPEESDVLIEILDIFGNRVRTLTRGMESSGKRTIEWNLSDDAGRRVPSGTYFCRLKAGNEVRTEKITVLR